MRAAISLVVFALLLIAPASASEEADAFARVQQLFDAWNKNDSATVASVLTESIEIIDSTAPYHWSGTHALQAWSDSFAADAKANSVTEPSLELLQPTHVDLGAGDTAYVVVPAIYHWKKGAEKMQEKGIITAALHKVDQKWRVAATAWTRQ